MSELAPLSLDDLTYEDLRQLAMRRVPAASGGRWTHHEPVDAGVTLLELFAFLLDQQIFVLDQVPDSLTFAILALLDEAPQPTGVARTIVAPEVPVGASPVGMLPGGSLLRPQDPGLAELAVTTREDVWHLPVAAIDVATDSGSISDRLDRGVAVPVMTERGGGGRLSLEISLDVPVAVEDVDQPMAIAVLLNAAGVPPEWSADAADVPPPVDLHLTWSAPTGAAGEIADWVDGTRGLRRSGVLQFALPEGALGADRLRFTLATEAADFAAPPEVRGVVFGAAIAEHRVPVEVPVAALDTAAPTPLQAALINAARALLPISGQVLALPDELSPALGESITLRLGDRAGEVQDWRATADLTPHGPEDRVFVFDRENGRLSFGDGYTGRVPAPVTSIGLSLALGGGPAGNHAAGLGWQAASDHRALVSVDQAEGGRAPETLAEARARAAAGLGERFRAVTAEDYAALVQTTRGLPRHRALVLPGHDPNFPCLEIADSVTVFVVPPTDLSVVDPQADDGALAAFDARLQAARMLTTRVFVRRPLFRPVELEIDLAAAQGQGEALADLLRPVLTAYLHPSLGGASGDGWPFGGALRPSELLRVAQESLEVGARVERVEIRLADSGEAEDCTELAIGPAELPYLAALRLRLTGTAPEGVSL